MRTGCVPTKTRSSEFQMVALSLPRQSLAFSEDFPPGGVELLSEIYARVWNFVGQECYSELTQVRHPSDASREMSNELGMTFA